MFSSINKTFAIVQKYLAGTVFVIIPLTHGSADTVDQSTDGVCSLNLPTVPVTLSGVSVPQRRSTARRVWLNAAQSGSRPLLVVEKRPVPHLCGLNRPAPSGVNAPLEIRMANYG